MLVSLVRYTFYVVGLSNDDATRFVEAVEKVVLGCSTMMRKIYMDISSVHEAVMRFGVARLSRNSHSVLTF